MTHDRTFLSGDKPVVIVCENGEVTAIKRLQKNHVAAATTTFTAPYPGPGSDVSVVVIDVRAAD